MFYVVMALVMVFSLAAVAVPAGPVGAQATTLQVDATTGTIHTGDPCPDPRDSAVYADIQAAINCALAGDTIVVHDGTYTEDLKIELKTDITLRSENGSGATTIQLVDGVGIEIQGTADNLTFGGAAGQGFTINSGTDTGHMIVLANNPSGVEISYDTINTTGSATMGISVGAAGATRLTISNNTFTADAGDGSIWGPEVVDVTVDNNTFTGPGGPPASGYAVEFAGVTATSPSTINGNTITGYSMGIAIFNGEGTSNLVIDGNTITGCKNGIRLGQYSPTTHGDMTTVRVTGNTLTNNTIGLRVNPAGANVRASQFVIKFNNISGSTTGLQNDAAEQVTAELNWWGDSSGPNDPNGTTEVPPCTGDPATEKNADGSGDAVSDNVDYCPWLGASVADSKTEEGTGNFTVDATAEANAEVTVTGTGSTTVTVARYSGNPGGAAFFSQCGYIDVHLSDVANVTQVVIKLYCASAEVLGYRMHWWNGTAWVPCSNQVAVDGYIEVTITGLTTPSLADLTGTPFGAGSYVVGGQVYPVDLALGTTSDQPLGGGPTHTSVALWLGLALILAIGGGVLALRRRRAH